MAKTSSRTRFLAFPYSREIFGSRIERLRETPGPRRTSEIHVDLCAVLPLTDPELILDDGQPVELLRGNLVPLRLRFLRASWSSRTGYFSELDSLPRDHGARRLFDIVHLRPAGRDARYWLFADINTSGHELSVRASECVLEERPGRTESVEFRRRWAYRPPTLPGRSVSQFTTKPYRYGGDSIAIRLGNRTYRHRLFIGGLHHQYDQRPLVDHVLNLCGVPNPWQERYGIHPADRLEPKGELVDGMSLDDLVAEATWIVERLHAGQSALVHCYAGVNRSSTVCCAVLMLLEGLSAEDALTRVRMRHPEAAPDPYHWLLLCWLERQAHLEPDFAPSHMYQPEPLRATVAIR